MYRVSRSGSTSSPRPPASSQRRARGAIVILLAVGVASGCTATIHKRDGSVVEGIIVRSDSSAVYVERECGVEIALKDIADIYQVLNNFTITKVDGSVVKTKGLRRGSSSVFLDDHCDEQAIPRADIFDIDHPGKTPAVIATPFMGASVILVIVGAVLMAQPKGDEGEDDDGGWADALVISNQTKGKIVLGAGLGVLGASAAVAIPGWATWNRSRSAAGFGSQPAPEFDPDSPHHSRKEDESAESLLGCVKVFAAQEMTLGRLEALLAERSPTTDKAFRWLLAEAAERERRHERMCFGYYSRGQSLKERRVRLVEQIGTNAPSGGEAPPEDAPADDHPPTEGERPPAGDSFTLHFLGIAPVASGDRDMKGVVVGFQF